MRNTSFHSIKLSRPLYQDEYSNFGLKGESRGAYMDIGINMSTSGFEQRTCNIGRLWDYGTLGAMLKYGDSGANSNGSYTILTTDGLDLR